MSETGQKRTFVPDRIHCRGLAAVAAWIAAGMIVGMLSPGMASERPPPLPPPRPPELGPPPSQTKAKDKSDEADGSLPSGDAACLQRLTTAGFEFEIVAPPEASNPNCIIDTPVRLRAVKVSSRPKVVIRLSDEPILSCRFGERFGQWLGELAAPVIAGHFSSEVKAVRTGPGYECRNRNRAKTGKISAHALGLAIDISNFELANGKVLPVKPNGDDRDRAVVSAVRTAACGWFTTVLGPGSDAAHAEHLHVDILQHGSSDRYRICE